jgi:hypothetical protein
VTPTRRRFLSLGAAAAAVAVVGTTARRLADSVRSITGDVATTLPRGIAIYKGLMVRNGDPAKSAYPPNIEVVIDDIYDTATNTIKPNNVIDRAIASGKPFRVRIKGMLYAPQSWKDEAGTFTDYHTREGNTKIYPGMPRTWESSFVLRHTAFLGALAARYDGVFFYLSGCSWVFAEGCIRDCNDDRTRKELLAAGYTFEADIAAQHAMIDAAATVFSSSTTGMAFSAYDHLYPDGTRKVEIARTVELMTYYRSKFGSRAYLTNNSLEASSRGGIFDAIPAQGVPFGFQTTTLPRIGNCWDAVDNGIRRGAQVIELPAGYQTVLTPTQLASFNARLKAN